jgi:hypothetical protein
MYFLYKYFLSLLGLSLILLATRNSLLSLQVLIIISLLFRGEFAM